MGEGEGEKGGGERGKRKRKSRGLEVEEGLRKLINNNRKNSNNNNDHSIVTIITITPVKTIITKMEKQHQQHQHTPEYFAFYQGDKKKIIIISQNPHTRKYLKLFYYPVAKDRGGIFPPRKKVRGTFFPRSDTGEELTTSVLGKKGLRKEVMFEVCKEAGIDIRADMRKGVVGRRVIGARGEEGREEGRKGGRCIVMKVALEGREKETVENKEGGREIERDKPYSLRQR